MPHETETESTIYDLLLIAFLLVVATTSRGRITMIAIAAFGCAGLAIMEERLRRDQMIATAVIFLVGTLGTLLVS